MAEAAERSHAWVTQLYARDVLREFVAACESANIDVLPVKGIVTGRQLYEDVAERPISDIDVRIRRRDFGALLHLVREHGWQVGHLSHAYRAVVVSFGGIAVDARAYVAPPGMCALSTDELIARATRTDTLHGFSHLVPELHDHAVLLVANAFKDKLVHVLPGPLRDLERLVVHPGFRVDTFVARLRAARCLAMARIVAEWMVHERGCRAWEPVRRALGGDEGRRAYLAALRRLLEVQPKGELALRLLTRAISDDPLLRVLALGKMAHWQLETWRGGASAFRRREHFWLEPARRPSPPPKGRLS